MPLYQKASLVFAEKQAGPFTVVDARTGVHTQGQAGDYLVRNHPETRIGNKVDEWIVPAATFEATYEEVNLEDVDLELDPPNTATPSAIEEELGAGGEDPAFRPETPAEGEPEGADKS